MEEEAAFALNGYYHSVFTDDNHESPTPEFPSFTHERLDDIVVSKELVEEILTGLNPNKAAGLDGVESRLLKMCAKEMAPILCGIFQKSMDDGEVPSKWKEANIVPIHKKGNKAIMANFRPVALTSVICKVFEKSGKYWGSRRRGRSPI